MPRIQPKPLPLSPATDPESPAIEARYTPLSAFGSTDYIEDYGRLLDATGAFDKLRYSAAELHVRPNHYDLAGLASLASALVTLLTDVQQVEASQPGGAPKTKRLRTLVLDHCQRFRVEVQPVGGSAWEKLDTVEAIEEWLDFGQVVTLLSFLVREVLRPLFSRLSSTGEDRPNESPTPSANASATT